MQEIVKLLTENANLHWKILGYEAVDFLFNDAFWMYDLLTSPFADLFNFLFTTLFNNIKIIFTNSKDKIDMTADKLDAPRIFFRSTNEFTPCEFYPNLEVKMLIRNVEIITYTLYAIYYDILKISL